MEAGNPNFIYKNACDLRGILHIIPLLRKNVAVRSLDRFEFNCLGNIGAMITRCV